MSKKEDGWWSCVSKDRERQREGREKGIETEGETNGRWRKWAERGIAKKGGKIGNSIG